MPLPTYAELEPQGIAWAAARELVTADGKPDKATPLSQHGKTMEEIGEATEALWALQIERKRLDDVQDLRGAAESALALEFGDVLVTLGLQAGMHGSTIEQCKAESGRLTTGYGSDWVLGGSSHWPKTWAYVDQWAALLGDALTNIDSPYRFDIAGLIGALVYCTEDAARIELSLMGSEVLALALAKIAGRTGSVVGGVFVKAA
jgi:NTP pyrophosphatase (non-canonical NTP hydrolase)